MKIYSVAIFPSVLCQKHSLMSLAKLSNQYGLSDSELDSLSEIIIKQIITVGLLKVERIK